MTKRTYTQLKPEFYVEVTSDLAELITVEECNDKMYRQDLNGDTVFTDEAQDIFNKNMDRVTDIFDGCGIESGDLSTECMRIDSSSNVGIGTSSPAKRLTKSHSVRIKYFGPTNTKPSRIKAIWQSAERDLHHNRTFKSKTIERDYALIDGYAIWAAEQCLEYLNSLTPKAARLAIDRITLGSLGDDDVVLFSTYYPEHEEPSK